MAEHRVRAARWLAGADPGGLLYGAIVSAAVLVTVSAHAEDTDHVILATSVFLVVYWMAHVYIETLSTQFRGDQKPFASRLRHAAGHEASVLKGGAPAIVVYAVASLAGADPSNAAAAAAYFSVALLVVIGYLGAHHAGVRGWPLVGEVAAAGSFGVLIVLGKTLLH
ncbi:MAG: hypothetical protein ABWY19_04660 [Marmoricola sp.]